MCNPTIRDPQRLWCAEHGRYEDRCFLCHPEIEDKDRLFCEEHGLYEDECYICHPDIKDPNEESETSVEPTKKQTEFSKQSGFSKQTGLFCNEHQLYERECGICHPELLVDLSVGQGLKVRFGSKESVKKAGIKTSKGTRTAQQQGGTYLCRLRYNQNRLAKVTPLATGVVQQVYVDYGDWVDAGSVLAEVASIEIAEAKAAFLNALSEHKFRQTVYHREKGLFEKKVSSRQEYEEAEAEFHKSKTRRDTAWQTLENFGFSENDVTALAENGDASSRFYLKAPFSSTIVDRDAVIGDVVSTQRSLFSLADLSTMWLELSIPIDEYAGIEVGNQISATFRGLDGHDYSGEIIWISPAVNESNRMVQARALVRNESGLLKEGMLGEAMIANGSTRGLRLPDSAIQRIDEENVVFVLLEGDLFEIRKVLVGRSEAGHVSIVSGLTPEDSVVVSGSFTVKSEYLKSRLGAGCVHE